MEAISSKLFLYVRTQRNLSQAGMAIRLNVNQSTISKIEKGMHRPRAKLTQKLEVVAQKKLQDLIRLVREAE